MTDQARALLVGAGVQMAPTLHRLGVRADVVATTAAAMSALAEADASFAPYALVLAMPIDALALGQAIPVTGLMVPPPLVAITEALHDSATLHSALAPVLANAQHMALPGIDIGAGLEMVAGDRCFYQRLIERFASAHRHSAQAMADDVAGGQMAELARRAHTLRGSANTIGAKALGKSAAALELALGTSASAAEVAALQAQVDAGLGEVIAGLDAHFAALHGAAGDAHDSTGSALAVRDGLLAMLAQFDGDALEFFENGRASLAAVVPQATLDEVAGHLARYEFDLAAGVVRGAFASV